MDLSKNTEGGVEIRKNEEESEKWQFYDFGKLPVSLWLPGVSPEDTANGFRGKTK